MKGIEKKKIFKIYVQQTFNALDIEDSGKWYKPDKIKEFRDTVENFEHLILANNLEEAIEKYKERYNWNYTSSCIDVWYGYGLFNSSYPKINDRNPEYECTVVGYETKGYTFNKLKNELRASDFMEYCRQELYPIEVILAEKENI